MKVLLLSGANTIHTLRWANGLVDAGVELVCVSQHQFMPGPWDERVERVQLPKSPKWGYLVNGREVARLFRKHRCDLLNVHYASGYGLQAMLSGIHPRVLSVWGSDVFDFPTVSPLHREMVRRTLRSADVVASTSHVMAEQVRKVVGAGGLERPIAITPFGVDTARFGPSGRGTAKGSRPLVIGTVKKLESKYGIDTLIHAFAKLRAPPHGFLPVLRLVGEGQQEPELRALATTAGVSARVEFVGAVPHGQVPDQLRQFDVFVAASRLDSESFGVAVIEASACELPVVVTRVGGLPEVVRDGETGLIVPKGDIEALANALQQLLDSDALRTKLGRAGRTHVRANYEWRSCIGRMIDVYQDTLRAFHSGSAMQRPV